MESPLIIQQKKRPKAYIVHNGDIVVGMDGIFHINSWSGGNAYLVQRALLFQTKNRRCERIYIPSNTRTNKVF